MVTHTIPVWLHGYLDGSDVVAVEETIKKAEEATIGEVVAVIVRRSACVGHVFPLLGLALFSIFLMVTHEPIWFSEVGYHGPLAIGSGFLLAFALAWPLARLPFVQRLLTKSDDLWLQARERAELEFYAAGLDKTTGRSGVLLFISFTEHQVFVLADKGIAEKLPVSTWAEVTQLVTTSLRDKQFARGLGAAIERCGAILTQHFPSESGNPNELKDHLIIKD